MTNQTDEHMQAKEEEHRVITLSGVHVIEPFEGFLHRRFTLRESPCHIEDESCGALFVLISSTA